MQGQYGWALEGWQHHTKPLTSNRASDACLQCLLLLPRGPKRTSNIQTKPTCTRRRPLPDESARNFTVEAGVWRPAEPLPAAVRFRMPRRCVPGVRCEAPPTPPLGSEGAPEAAECSGAAAAAPGGAAPACGRPVSKPSSSCSPCCSRTPPALPAKAPPLAGRRTSRGRCAALISRCLISCAPLPLLRPPRLLNERACGRELEPGESCHTTCIASVSWLIANCTQAGGAGGSCGWMMWCRLIDLNPTVAGQLRRVMYPPQIRRHRCHLRYRLAPGPAASTGACAAPAVLQPHQGCALLHFEHRRRRPAGKLTCRRRCHPPVAAAAAGCAVDGPAQMWAQRRHVSLRAGVAVRLPPLKPSACRRRRCSRACLRLPRVASIEEAGDVNSFNCAWALGGSTFGATGAGLLFGGGSGGRRLLGGQRGGGGSGEGSEDVHRRSLQFARFSLPTCLCAHHAGPSHAAWARCGQWGRRQWERASAEEAQHAKRAGATCRGASPAAALGLPCSAASPPSPAQQA